MELSGKQVLVTGGAVRVGAALVRAFALAGAHVCIHYFTHRVEAEALLEEIGGTAGGHSIVSFDLSAPGDLAIALERLEPFDILVNNASTFIRAKMAGEDYSDSLRQMNVNFFAPVELMRIFARRFTGSEGVVINIVDQAVSGSFDGDSFSYLISKKMLWEATCAAALEFAPCIRVMAVAPGPVIAPPGLEHLNMASTLKSVPLGRKVALDDLVQAVLFAASNSSVTGSMLTVDCGRHLMPKRV